LAQLAEQGYAGHDAWRQAGHLNVVGHAEPGKTNGVATASSLHVMQVFQPQIGGVPCYAANLARGLLASGWRVSVACPPQAQVCEGLAVAGVEILPLEVQRSPHPRQDGRAVRKLARWCRERDVSLIHGHSTKAGLLVALAGRSAGVPSVYTPHGWSFERLVMPALRASYAVFERELAHHCHAAVLTVSASGRAAAERWRVAPRGRIQVIPTGLPPFPPISRSTARKMLGLAQDDIVAAWVGRVGPPKRPEDLAPIARGLGDTVTVLALCDGIHGTALAMELRQAGVVLVDPAFAPGIVYAAADMLLHTSVWEAAPLVVLEAMWAGLPIVSYDVGGLAEQVQAGRTGYLVQPGDVEMMCECVLALARRPALRGSMGNASRERVSRLFNYFSMLDRIRQTYVTVAERRPTAQRPRGLRSRGDEPAARLAEMLG
jgi:glycosyltransferase involved in cell wall biosynthesis